MEVTVLGSGTAFPSSRRNPAGYLVRTTGLNILVDIGPGIIRRMCEAEIDVRCIDVVMVTHFHPDHITDLITFLFMSNHGHSELREQRFYTIGPNGLELLISSLTQAFGKWIVPSGNRRVGIELNAEAPDSYQLGEVIIYSAPANHHPPCLSYRIEAEGRVLVISGDTDKSETLVSLARGADLLICESSFPDSIKVPGHLTASEAGATAAASGVKRLVLTHFYPQCDVEDVKSQAAGCFSGEIIKAEDHMTLVV